MSEDGMDRGGTVGIEVVATARVPTGLLNEDMSDEEIRSAVLQNGEVDAIHELAVSTSTVRDILERSVDTDTDRSEEGGV